MSTNTKSPGALRRAMQKVRCRIKYGKACPHYKRHY